jgi:hypothetical protein
MNEKPKIEGWRKLGIGISAITALSISTIDFKIAVIIAVIAVTGIITQGVLDYEKRKIQQTDTGT